MLRSKNFRIVAAAFDRSLMGSLKQVLSSMTSMPPRNLSRRSMFSGLTSQDTASWLVMTTGVPASKAFLRLVAVAMEYFTSCAKEKKSFPQAQLRIDFGARISVGMFSCFIASITTRVFPVPGSEVLNISGSVSRRWISRFWCYHGGFIMIDPCKD